MNRRFSVASWPTKLTVISTVTPVLLFAVFFFGGRTLRDDPVGRVIKPVLFYVPFVLLIGALLFIVSGYEIDRTELRIRRLLWSTVIPLRGLTRVWYDAEAMRESLRVAGNGGLFSFSGIFYSKALGRYRAFVTDPRSAVVIVMLNRTVVITPENPDSFVECVRNLFPSVGGKPPQDPQIR